MDTHIFIGYDPTQDLAFRACKKSIEEASLGSNSLYIHKLDAQVLRKIGMFNREWTIEGTTGRYKDNTDEKNFSTAFAHSRFLVPAYAEYLGVDQSSLVIFVDSDFIFFDNPENLQYEIKKNPDKHLYTVKHKYSPKSVIKMNNAVQEGYEYKLWTSLMVFNMKSCLGVLKPEVVNKMSGEYLHRFGWLSDPKHHIGAISEAWNFIPDHSEPRVSSGQIRAIHFTEGTPLHPGYENCRYSAAFNHFLRLATEEMKWELTQ